MVRCVTLAYTETRLVEAAERQLRRLPYQHTFFDATSEPISELAERLVHLAPAPMSKAYFTVSGSEANDTALKFVSQYWRAHGQPQRRKVLAHLRGYHGSTVASGSLTGIPVTHTDHGMPLPGFLHVSCPHAYCVARPGETDTQLADRLVAQVDALIEREGPDTIAAFFAEPVLGARGVLVPPAGYYEKLQAVLRRHGTLFVADEVVTGFGRTGNRWGSQTFGIAPDLLVCAKRLTAGYAPMAALLISQPVYEALRAQSAKLGCLAHGLTHSGNPVAAAVALEALRIYEERDICANVRAMGERLGAGLRALADHPLVGDVRGVGLMWAVDLVTRPRISCAARTRAG